MQLRQSNSQPNTGTTDSHAPSTRFSRRTGQFGGAEQWPDAEQFVHVDAESNVSLSMCFKYNLTLSFRLPTTSPLPSLQHLASKFGLSGHHGPPPPSQLPNPAVNGLQRPGMKYFAGLTQHHQAAAVAAQQQQQRANQLFQQQQKLEETRAHVGPSKEAVNSGDDCDMHVSVLASKVFGMF